MGKKISHNILWASDIITDRELGRFTFIFEVKIIFLIFENENSWKCRRYKKNG
jgi:hypothetical protein